MVSGMDANQNPDPSRWMAFLRSINNTAIADKIIRGKYLPRNLEEAMCKAVALEASFQLSEGLNMNRRPAIMNIDAKEEELNEVQKDVRARSNTCHGCGGVGHFFRDCENPDKQEYRRQNPPPQESDDKIVGKMNYTFRGSDLVTGKVFDALVSGIQREKRARKAAQKKLATAKTVPTTAAATTPAPKPNTRAKAAAPKKAPAKKAPAKKKDAKAPAKKTAVAKGQGDQAPVNPDGTVSGGNDAGPARNTRARTAARRQASVDSTANDQIIAEVLALSDVPEEESTDSEEIHELSDSTPTEDYMTDEGESEQ